MRREKSHHPTAPPVHGDPLPALGARSYALTEDGAITYVSFSAMEKREQYTHVPFKTLFTPTLHLILEQNVQEYDEINFRLTQKSEIFI